MSWKHSAGLRRIPCAPVNVIDSVRWITQDPGADTKLKLVLTVVSGTADVHNPGREPAHCRHKADTRARGEEGTGVEPGAAGVSARINRRLRAMHRNPKRVGYLPQPAFAASRAGTQRQAPTSHQLHPPRSLQLLLLRAQRHRCPSHHHRCRLQRSAGGEHWTYCLY